MSPQDTPQETQKSNKITLGELLEEVIHFRKEWAEMAEESLETVRGAKPEVSAKDDVASLEQHITHVFYYNMRVWRRKETERILQPWFDKTGKTAHDYTLKDLKHDTSDLREQFRKQTRASRSKIDSGYMNANDVAEVYSSYCIVGAEEMAELADQEPPSIKHFWQDTV